MTKYREILRLKNQGVSNRGIASSCNCSRNTVANVLKRSNEKGIYWPLEKDLTNGVLQDILFPEKNRISARKIPDCEYIHKELAKSGVTLSLLWDEYCDSCRLNDEVPYMYSQFCRYYRKYASTTKATMRIKRKPGEILEVDWAGTTIKIINDFDFSYDTAYLFVATLSCSMYTYVEAFLSMDTENWIKAHNNAFRFFGGVTRILIPDNLKTGVTKASSYTPIINKTYNEMAEHYGTVVIPARVRKPKDKPNAEGSVGHITTWIIAALRNQEYFTLVELNESIRSKLEVLNNKPFQKKEGSRRSAFIDEEKSFLLPLPASPYEVAYWNSATVQYDYHINVDKMHYSVPYEYIKCKVDIRITGNIIEVFYEGHRIASHRRLRGKDGNDRITLPEHMPDNHKKYLAWDTEHFIKWAETIGPNTVITTKSILTSHRVKQQGYRSCMALVKLGNKYSITRLESACQRALSYTPKPSLKSVQTILKTGQDKLDMIKGDEVTVSSKVKSSKFGFSRGASYYGGRKDD